MREYNEKRAPLSFVYNDDEQTAWRWRQRMAISITKPAPRMKWNQVQRAVSTSSPIPSDSLKSSWFTSTFPAKMVDLSR